jgi:hypothetical protein
MELLLMLRRTASQATRCLEGILKTFITACTTTSVFIYGLPNDAASSPDSIALISKMIDEY